MAGEVNTDHRAGQTVQSPPRGGAAGPETQPMDLPKPSTSASRRGRARLARRMTSQRSAVNPQRSFDGDIDLFDRI